MGQERTRREKETSFSCGTAQHAHSHTAPNLDAFTRDALPYALHCSAVLHMTAWYGALPHLL